MKTDFQQIHSELSILYTVYITKYWPQELS